MNLLKYLFFFLPLLFLNVNAFSQAKPATNCGRTLNGFVPDAQEYIIQNAETTTFDIVFYPGFMYRIELCVNDINSKLNMTLVDEKGNVQFVKIIGFGFYRDFRFETIFHGKIIIKQHNTNNKPSELLIGYKKITN